ncbi:fungal-specific transcription factor domain-containing protein [Aspergillus ambiguus]|uniref:transcription factor domain-containing protein n=1 Tax=Aspergillus ambiguus TaxID=176160 RepID=UPI003CCCF35D
MAASHPDHLDPLEIDILNRRDAFGLPAREICDSLIEIFFKWVAPILPVVNRHDFMKRYHNPADQPPILLLQAMLTVASRFSAESQCPNNTPRAFYKKAKALYDAGYEQNPITVIQAVILLGLYWDGLDDLVENGIFYWSRLGTALAQAEGLHESQTYTDLDPSESGLRKRIWWTLYTRDRSVAAAFGRPIHINTGDCTVEQLTETDFIERDETLQLEYPIDITCARFFIEYVKLCQLMDLGLCLKLSSRSTQDSRNSEAAHCELGLNEWLVSCPTELHWREIRHSFLPAILFSQFHTIVCQLQLLQEPYSSSESQRSAFNAASTVISILETLQAQGELQYVPSFTICHAVVSFVTLKHQMNASVPSLLHATKFKLDANLEILKLLSTTWPIARFFVELFSVTSTRDQFNQLLTASVEDCQRRADGDSDEPKNASQSYGPFRKPKIQQVILPQSRVVLQILARESQRRQTASSQASSHMNTANEPSRIAPSSGDVTAGSSDGFSAAMEECEPTAILQNLQKIINIGKSATHGADDLI